MGNKSHKILSVLAAFAFTLSAPAYASSVTPTGIGFGESEPSAEYDSVFTKGRAGTVTVAYTEGSDGEDPVPGAGFTLYRVASFTDWDGSEAGPGTGYRSAVDGLVITENTEGGFDMSVPVAGASYSRPEQVSPVPSGTASSGTASSGTASSGTASSGTASSEKTSSEKTSSEKASSAAASSSEGTLYVTVDTDPAYFRDYVLAYYEKAGKTDGMVLAGKTGTDGKLVFSEVDPGAYLMVETAPADGYFASAPLLVSVPEMALIKGTGQYGWNYDVKVSPKPVPAGSLSIKKTVTGTAGDKSKEIHFTVTLESADGDGYTYTTKERKIYLNPAELELHYKVSDGREGTVKSGGQIALSDGETALIDTIPAGTKYTVKETEDGADGYTTTKSGDTGSIVKRETAKAEFTNHKDAVPEETSKVPGYNTSDVDMNIAGLFLTGAAAMLTITIIFGISGGKRDK